MTLVEKRDTETIEAVIGTWVEDDTVIYTDEWRAYKSAIANLKMKGHRMVCHKKWFVDPITKIHIQSIEAFWSVFKRWLRKCGYNIGPAEETLSYIGEFL